MHHLRGMVAHRTQPARRRTADDLRNDVLHQHVGSDIRRQCGGQVQHPADQLVAVQLGTDGFGQHADRQHGR